MWLLLALAFWFANASLHDDISHAVAGTHPTPWGSFMPVDYTLPAAVLLALAAVALLAVQARRGGARTPTLLLWGLVLAAMVVCHNTLLTIGVEVVHYPQYALVGGLLAHALDPQRDRLRVLEALLLGTVLSALDEGWQYFHSMPFVYLDFNDLALNQIGLLGGLLYYYGFPRCQRPLAKGSRPLLMALLAGVGVLGIVILLLLYLGVLVVNPDSVVPRGGAVSLADGLRIHLQLEPNALGSVRAARRGGTYYVLGAGQGLAVLAVSVLLAWGVETAVRRQFNSRQERTDPRDA